MNYFKESILLISLFIIFSLRAQSQIIALDWSGSEELIVADQTYTLQIVKDFALDNGRPFFAFQQKHKQINEQIEILSIDYEKLPKEQALIYAQLGISFDTEPLIDAKVVSESGQAMLSIYMTPIRMHNGQLERISVFTYRTIPKTNLSSKDYVSSSVLGSTSGKWYRISVNKDGIYKIDKNFLNDCGYNTTNLNPAHIHIFGNGEGVIPESNSAAITDDLAQNAIFVAGEADGQFNDNDYLLFYGWGPHRWELSGGNQFNQVRHPYSDQSYYFIYIGSDIAPLRIATAPTIDTQEDTLVNAFDYRDVYENDLENLAQGGQRWYGEEFDVNLSQNFNFSIPNLTSDPVRIQVTYASNSRASGNQIILKKGTQVLGQMVMPHSGSYYQRGTLNCADSTPSNNLNLNLTINRINPNVVTYLDRILIQAKRNLILSGSQLNFRVANWSQNAALAAYQLSNTNANTFVWEVTDRHLPLRIPLQSQGSQVLFKTAAGYKEFVVASGVSFFTPDKVGIVANQDLHQLPFADYLIVTHPDFTTHANRLADLHRNNGLSVHVVPVQAVYNEFSSGMQDPGAIRRFVKMFYDRALLTDPDVKPKYLLLFGDGTYDPKDRMPNNNNFIVTYQMSSSENKIDAMVVDDFFGMLDDAESMSAADMLDLGVGRLIVSSPLQAKQVVDKIEHYMKNGSNFYPVTSSCCMGTQTDKTFGDWRNQYMVMTDNREGGYFINTDAEPQYQISKLLNPEINFNKLYMDAFPKVVTAGGERFPAMVSTIDANIQRGVLVANYIGHGGEVGLAEERVVGIDQINAWSNIHAFHLFVSATCEFTRFDDPERVSAGEWAFLNPTGGAIAMLTTTRSVYFGVNSNIGIKLAERVFNRYPDGSAYEFGEIARRTKNAASVSSSNKRSFTLIGDPALRLALPRYRIVTDSINGLDPNNQLDTLRALSKVRIKGHIEDYSGAVLSNWNGTLTPTIYDKKKIQTTLGQDEGSPVISYEQQTNRIYRGQSSINNGYFDFEFVVPKDIALQIDFGKISYYGHNGQIDAQGFDTLFYVGGIDPNGVTDDQGPMVQLYMNQEGFVDGSVTDENPVLLAKIADQNGINTVGNGIGHDIVAVLDGQTAQPFVLNDFYTSDLDSYQSGEVRYQFQNLSPGEHTLSLKVWDVNNNSSTAEINFVVQAKEAPVLEHVLNYPNPFTTRTEFMFEHNQSCSSLDVQIQIFTVSGRLVKTISQEVPTSGFRISGLFWDGRDDFGDELARGTYLYRLRVQTPEGAYAEQTEKLVLLK
ncbi:MAG: type IX secretion system sortase PorU [Sphingomonadales bacterium]